MSFNSLFRDQLQLISKTKIWQNFYFWKFEELGKPDKIPLGQMLFNRAGF